MAKNRPKEIEVVSREQLFAKGPFSINEINCRHELFQGGMSEPFPWMVFERGDAVAVVLYRRDIHQIVLVRQFRAPTLRFGDNPHVPINDGYLDEIIAGKPNAEDNLDYRACAMREVREETGYILQAGDLEEISRFYVSSGGTSERIILYFAEVTDRALAPNAAEIQGKSEDNENILVRHIPVSDFLAMTDVGEAAEDAIDSKILIASLLLRDRLRNVPREQREVADSIAVPYQLSDNAERRIILRAGHLGRVEDVPIWVNAESTDMELDRYSGTSMSSFIR
ncbi:MAG: NUDIX hydrolase, partial [Pseudomonadota bacterium]